MKSNKLVSIIIVNWNGKHHLESCLDSLSKITYKNTETILVDNASDDGSVKYTKKNFPKIKVVKNSKNLGFAEGNNIGIANSKGEYILLLNNDTKVSPTFLTELVHVLEENSHIAIAQSKIYMMDDPNRLDTVGSFLTPAGFLYHYGFAKKDSDQYSKEMIIYSAKGASMIIRRSVLEKIKVNGQVFDKDYFAYFEETDLCHRAWLAGYEIFFVPKSVVYHKIGATSSKLDNAFVQYHAFKNRINSYIKNLGSYRLIQILPLHVLLCFAISFLYLFRGKPKIWLGLNKAIVWNIGNLPKTLKKRKDIQERIRKIEDREFIPRLLWTVPPIYYFYTFWGKLGKFPEYVQN